MWSASGQVQLSFYSVCLQANMHKQVRDESEKDDGVVWEVSVPGGFTGLQTGGVPIHFLTLRDCHPPAVQCLYKVPLHRISPCTCVCRTRHLLEVRMQHQ